MSKTSWLGIVLSIVAFGLFCVSLPVLIYRGVDADIVMKLFSTVISWPVAITVIALVFLSRFRTSINLFLQNIRALSFPGGNVQMQTPASRGEEREEERKGESIKLTQEQTEELSRFIGQMQEGLNLANKEKEALEQDVKRWFMAAYGWKFTFLNTFYVPITKEVLFWFSRISPQSREFFHQVWRGRIPSLEQRSIILDVLVAYDMIKPEGMNYKITLEGYSFLQFIGYIPFAPSQDQ
jgi:hypothetical protein